MELPLEILERIVDTLNVGLVVLDKDDKIVLFNRKAGEMLKQDPEERIGSPLLRCHPERAEPGVLMRNRHSRARNAKSKSMNESTTTSKWG